MNKIRQHYKQLTTPLLLTLALGVFGTVAAGEDGQSWRLKGDEYYQQGELQKALDAYRKAEALGAGDEQLTMDIAQVYQDMDDTKSAYNEYKKNQFSADPDINAAACEALNDLHYGRNKTLKKPYFADLYTFTGGQTLGDLAFTFTQARIGAKHGDINPLELYLFATISGDTSDDIEYGGLPKAYLDNIGVVGVGVRKYLSEDWGLSAVAEAGWSYDLEYIGRDRQREDIRAGFELWKEWNTERDCFSKDHYPNRFVMTAWSELMYYTRYDDSVLFSAELRPGIRLYESADGIVDTFLILGGAVDFNNGDYDYGEVGAGISWKPEPHSDFKLIAQGTQIFDNEGDSESNFLVGFEYYGLW